MDEGYFSTHISGALNYLSNCQKGERKMKTMQKEAIVAQEMIAFLRPKVPAEQMEFVTGSFSAGEYLDSILSGCYLIRENHISGAESLLETALELGLGSKWFAPFYREFFSEQVA